MIHLYLTWMVLYSYLFRRKDLSWFAIFPDLDYPDYVWDIFGPKGMPRPGSNANDSSQTTFKDTNDNIDKTDETSNLNETYDELCAAINLTL